MGCATSAPKEPSHHNIQKANAAIDQHTKKYKQVESVKYKLLLLGAGESGKSTLLKQMRKIHGKKYGNEELMGSKPHLTQNVIEAMRTLAIYSDILGDQGRDTKVSDPKHREIRDRVACMSDKQKFTEENYNDFKILQSDEHIQRTLSFRNEFQLIDTYQYLFDHMHDYWKDDYMPTFDDLVHCRTRTSGLVKLKFQLSDNSGAIQEIYEIFDVGGQKNERRKWIHFFDNTTAIIFVVALSGYNQLLWEDNRSNRMKEAISLFQYIVNLNQLHNGKQIILFLNKHDLFEKRIDGLSKDQNDKNNVKLYFDSYHGDEHNKEEIIAFFEKKFKDQRRKTDENGNKIKIHFHLTDATSTDCIRVIFGRCREIVIKAELQKNHFL